MNLKKGDTVWWCPGLVITNQNHLRLLLDLNFYSHSIPKLYTLQNDGDVWSGKTFETKEEAFKDWSDRIFKLIEEQQIELNNLKERVAVTMSFLNNPEHIKEKNV